MSLSQPKPPDAGLLAYTQTQMNQSAAESQRALNEQNFAGPFGGTNYTNNTVTSWLSPEMQSLVDAFQGTQGKIGAGVNTLAGNIAGNANYTGLPDFTSASAPLVKSQMAAFNDYMQPTYKNQLSNLQSQLAEQGITQGSDAWNNAMRGYYTSQDQANQSALMNFEPQAYSQAVQSYELPLQTLASLFGMTQPGAAVPGTQQPYATQYSPQENIQPANYMGAAQTQFQNQQQQFQNTMAGLGQLGSGLVSGAGGGNAVSGLFGGLGQGIGNILGTLAVPAIG